MKGERGENKRERFLFFFCLCLNGISLVYKWFVCSAEEWIVCDSRVAHRLDQQAEKLPCSSDGSGCMEYTAPLRHTVVWFESPNAQWIETEFVSPTKNFFPMTSGASEWASGQTNERGEVRERDEQCGASEWASGASGQGSGRANGQVLNASMSKSFYQMCNGDHAFVYFSAFCGSIVLSTLSLLKYVIMATWLLHEIIVVSDSTRQWHLL